MVVVLACGVQDTELELDTLEGVLETPEELAEVPAASSSEPGQLWGARWEESTDLGPYSGCEAMAEFVTIGGRGSRLTEAVEAVLEDAPRLVL